MTIEQMFEKTDGWIQKKPQISLRLWSGKRGSNSRPQPWQGCALPTELFPRFCFAIAKVVTFSKPPKFFATFFLKKFTFFQFFTVFTPFHRKYSLNHRLKLSQEAYIILKIVAQILNLPLKHCNSLNTHSKCKA